MLLSKTTGYGIRSLAFLARQPKSRLCGLQELAEGEKVPPVFLRKILGELRRHRLVTSLKGIHGGYAIAKPADEITLWDVFTILDSDPYWDRCVLTYAACSTDSPCVFCPMWQRQRQEFFSTLKNTTIADIARGGSPAGVEPR